MGQKTLRALGTGLGTASPLANGLTANQQADANAAISRADAAVTISESRRRAHEINRAGRARAGKQKARAAGAGFTQEGTSLILQLDELAAAQFNANEEIRVGRAGENRALQSAANTVRRGKTARNVGIATSLGKGVQALGSAEQRKVINATT